MEMLAGLFVVQQKAADVVSDREVLMDSLIDDITASFAPKNKADRMPIPVPEDMPSLLSHIEAFPLAIHDLRNKIGGIQSLKEWHEDIPEEDPLKFEVAKRVDIQLEDIAIIADESIDFFVDPLSATRTVGLSEVNRIITKTAASQISATGLPILMVPLSAEETSEKSLQLSTFLLRSLVNNAAQNTRRAALEVTDHPVLAINLSVVDGKKMQITIHDNAGGFSDEYLINKTTGTYSSVESQRVSQGRAIHNLTELITQSRGTIEFYNEHYVEEGKPPGQFNDGAKIKVTFPLAV